MCRSQRSFYLCKQSKIPPACGTGMVDKVSVSGSIDPTLCATPAQPRLVICCMLSEKEVTDSRSLYQCRCWRHFGLAGRVHRNCLGHNDSALRGKESEKSTRCVHHDMKLSKQLGRRPDTVENSMN